MNALIDVQMCDDPVCEGLPNCPQVQTAHRTLGMTLLFPPEEPSAEEILGYFRQELYLSKASDISGRVFWVPDGCAFVVHKLAPDAPSAPGPSSPYFGEVPYAATLRGPDADLDGLLASASPFEPSQTQERLERLNAA